MKASLACPPMAIKRISRNLRRADAEPIAVTITRDDGIEITFTATIPMTDVHKVDFLGTHWRVSACVAGTDNGKFICDLPPEDVLLKYDDTEGEFAMMAQPILCPVTFIDTDGTKWDGVVTFPEVEADFEGFAVNVAEAVTVECELTRAA